MVRERIPRSRAVRSNQTKIASRATELPVGSHFCYRLHYLSSCLNIEFQARSTWSKYSPVRQMESIHFLRVSLLVSVHFRKLLHKFHSADQNLFPLIFSGMIQIMAEIKRTLRGARFAVIALRCVSPYLSKLQRWLKSFRIGGHKPA